MEHRKKMDLSDEDLRATAWSFAGPAVFLKPMSLAMKPLPSATAHFQMPGLNEIF